MRSSRPSTENLPSIKSRTTEATDPTTTEEASTEDEDLAREEETMEIQDGTKETRDTNLPLLMEEPQLAMHWVGNQVLPNLQVLERDIASHAR